MNLFDRIIAETPRIHRILGKISTTIATVSGGLLVSGHVTTKGWLVALTIASLAFGGQAVYHAQKTK